MIKLSHLPSPVVAGVVKEKTKNSAIAEIKNCLYDGAGMIDLHLPCLESTDHEILSAIIESSKIPVLALNYHNDINGNDCGFTEDERAELFLKAIDCGASGIDMQGYTFDAKSKDGFFGENKYSFTKGSPKEVVTDKVIIEKQCDFIDKVHSKNAEVLLSCHPGIPMNSTQVVELALFLEKRKPDIIKIVTIAENEDDLTESFKAMQLLKREVRTKVCYHAGGKAGALSRIINPILGSHIVFCVDRYKESSLMEQLDLKTVKTIVDSMRKI